MPTQPIGAYWGLRRTALEASTHQFGLWAGELASSSLPGLYISTGGALASELSACIGSVLPVVSNSVVTLLLHTPEAPDPSHLRELLGTCVDLSQPQHAVVLDCDRRPPAEARPPWQLPALEVYHGPCPD